MDTDKLNRLLTLTANLGILIGLVLLIVEIRQNTDLVRAQIAMDRTSTRTQILSDWANGGEIVPIEAKLFEQVEGFPLALGWSDLLTTEENRRYRYKMNLRASELSNDWFLCTVGLINQEICQREVRIRMRVNLHRFYETGHGFTRWQSDYIEAMQELALEEGLPAINDDGTWQR
jgi:hypothetical protein